MDKNDRRLLDALAELDRRGIQHERGEGCQRNFFNVWRADSPTARTTVTRSMVEMDPGGVEKCIAMEMVRLGQSPPDAAHWGHGWNG